MEDNHDAKMHTDTETTRNEDRAQRALRERRERKANKGAVTGEEAANRLKSLRTIVSVAAIILVVAVVFLTWTGEDGFYIKIPTKDGFVWTLEGYDQAHVTVTSEGMEDGYYVCRLTGIAEGNATVDVSRSPIEHPELILEQRTYNLQVVKDNVILQRSVSRTVLEE